MQFGRSLFFVGASPIAPRMYKSRFAEPWQPVSLIYPTAAPLRGLQWASYRCPASRNRGSLCLIYPTAAPLCGLQWASHGCPASRNLWRGTIIQPSSLCQRSSAIVPSAIVPLPSFLCHRSAKRDIYAKPTASREAAQLWVLRIRASTGSAKRDLYIHKNK